ncbi:type III-A CRISPR-associated protein Cas10/Csm1 [Thermoactinomyces mirandus]|uniref:CRISPR system single-strand-specific deoxyribonuclease Cas10/Csm1 (subtype III-A) n=1 Tax=Thermoactinomyces mirandus TaxID=2756294 RepID=A0A7W2AQK5_9BACL|nr:type III-A CRISPR-associated protein Cas10/Csm1 [Thermoactinomyces mirandus]MBA4602059.1 type III-A CRISPR-associated protein Cas10/Csm1 [Thermoactinomyces mirandus]
MNHDLLAAASVYPLLRWFKQSLDAESYQQLIGNLRSYRGCIDGERACAYMDDAGRYLRNRNHFDQMNIGDERLGQAFLLIKALQTLGAEQMAAKNRERLESVFAQIELEKEFKASLYYPMQTLSVTDIFPEPEPMETPEEVQRHATAFAADLQDAWCCNAKQPSVLITGLQRVIDHYAWCIPAGDHGQQAVSLAEVCKQLCALTAAWSASSAAEENRIVLVVGDLSGIQRYIFDIAQTGTGGVAKRLRARSFFLGVLSDIIAHKILHAFDLPLANMILSSGGKFYILLPGGKETEQFLLSFQQELDRWMLEEYLGELVCNLVHVEVEAAELRTADRLLERLSRKLQRRKSSQLAGAFQSAGEWNEEAFVQKGHNPLSRCKCCKKFTAPHGDLCRICAADEKLGRRLPSANYIVFRIGKSEDIPGFMVMDNYYVDVLEDQPVESDNIYLVYELNRFDREMKYNLPVTTKYMANYVPVADQDLSINEEKIDPGHPLPFTFIADQAKGQKQLACLKADVDMLGSVFVFGLKKENDSVLLPQISTLSKMLELFFSGWLNEQMKRNYQHVYTVFSGGDDLFLIGPWNEIIPLAIDLRKSFARYVGKNPNLSLSAGITVCKPRLPIVRQAEWTENELDHAKQSSSIERPHGRNQISIFNWAMTWGRFESFWQEAQQLGEMWNENKIASAFLFRLLKYAEQYKSYKEKGDISGLRFYPRLAYDLSRNFTDKSDEEAKHWAQRFLTLADDHPLEKVEPLIRLSRLFRASN